MPYFSEHLQKSITSLPGVAEFFIEWDDNFDWTPDDLADSAKAKLENRRKRLEQVIENMEKDSAQK